MIWDRAKDFKDGDAARVYDADGNEILHIIWMDTDTGEVVQLRHDGKGFVPNEDRSDIIHDRRTYPAPLRVVPITEPTA